MSEEYVTDLGIGNILDHIIALGEDEYSVREVLSINDTDISAEFATHASKMGFWGVTQVTVESAYLAAKASREREHALAYSRCRNELNETAQKVTEARIASLILLDLKYKVAQDKERDAYERFNIVKMLVSALRVRGDMLISLGATMRAEHHMTDAKINEMVKNKLSKD